MSAVRTIRSFSLLTKLVVLFSTLVGFLSLFMYFFIPSRLELQSEQAQLTKTYTIARMTAFSLSSALYFADIQTLHDELQNSKLNNDVLYVVIHNDSGKSIASFNPDGAARSTYTDVQSKAYIGKDTSVLKLSTPILYKNKSIGTLYIGVLLNDVIKEVEHSRNNIALLSSIIFAIGILTVYGISSLITKPLRHIVKTMEHIAEGDLSRRAIVTTEDEIGHAAASFNRMVSHVQEAQTKLEDLNKTLEIRVSERTRELTNENAERRATEARLRESEERYRLLVELSPDAIVIHQKGKFVYSNASGARMFGFNEAGELIGRPIIDFVHPAYRDVVHERIRKIGEGSQAPMLQEKFIRFDGTVFDVEVAAIPTEFQGAPAVQVVIRDITERKKAEEALHASEIEMRALFASMRDVIVVLDTDGTYLKIAPTNPGLLPLPVHELKGKTLNDVLPEKEAAQILSKIRQTIETGEVQQVEFSMVISEKEVWFLGALSPMTAETVLWVARDITERKQAEKEYRNLEQKLLQSQKLESLGTLAGGIAHDFNNILAIILGYTNFLQLKYPQYDSLQQSLESITTAVNRGANLVRQILTFARKADQVFGLLDVNAMITEHVTMLTETFPKIITVKADLDTSLPHIYADPTQFHQIVLNLCVNARDAMPEGGTLLLKTRSVDYVHVKKRFPEATEHDYLCMSISDTGIGMNDVTVKRIFDPFFTTKGIGKGTGLGLPVVYGIMQGHKGFIDVESSPGNGSVFSLYFPISPEVLAKSKGSEYPPEELTKGTETILFIEDEEAVRVIATIQLELQGYTVILAKDGEEGIELFSKYADKIDIVFSDLGLPLLDGEQVFAKLREIRPNIKFIFASGFIDAEKRAELLKAGADDILHKPYQASQMLNSIRRTLDASKG